jgi:hypothetical protein
MKKLSLIVFGLLLVACNLDVTNPGPVQDSFLVTEDAQLGVVNGTGRALSEAMNYVSYTGAAISREITPSGSIGSFGISLRQQEGNLDANETSTHWSLSSRARWMAEDGATRMATVYGSNSSSNANYAKILLYAGYANRLMGENFCCAVIDGGAATAGSTYFDRALTNFNEAITVATSAGETALVTAAKAGRASVYVSQGKWSDAVSEANEVLSAGGDNFKYELPYFDGYGTDVYNRIYYATSGDGPYRAGTVWRTAYEEYTQTASDARVGFIYKEKAGGAAWTPAGGAELEIESGDATVNGKIIPWLAQQKHANRNSPIRLSSSQEMYLIKAEAALNSGSVSDAVTNINAVRTLAGVDPIAAADATAGWTMLKRERGIELWLEARRLGDMRRWKSTSAPGTYHAYETTNWEGAAYAPAYLSFPISQGEMDTNPNIPLGDGRPY